MSSPIQLQNVCDLSTLPSLDKLTDVMTHPVMMHGNCLVISVRGKVEMETGLYNEPSAKGMVGRFVFTNKPGDYGVIPTVLEIGKNNVCWVTDRYHNSNGHVGSSMSVCPNCPNIGSGYWKVTWVQELVKGNDPLWELVSESNIPTFSKDLPEYAHRMWSDELCDSTYDRFYCTKDRIFLAHPLGVTVASLDHKHEYFTIPEYRERCCHDKEFPKLPELVTMWKDDLEKFVEENKKSEEKKVQDPGAFKYLRSFKPGAWKKIKKSKVNSVTFDISWRGKHKHTLKFGEALTVSQAVNRAEEYLYEPLTQAYYNHIKDDLYPNARFSELMTRDEALGRCTSIKDVVVKDGKAFLICEDV